MQYAERVWKITGENKEHVIDKAINHTADFYRSIGIKTRLSEHNVGDDIINEIVERFRKRNTILGENRNINADKVLQILNLCK